MGNPKRCCVGLAVALLTLVGCGKSDDASAVRTSGFLGNYSDLTKGRAGQARLIYINPEADFSDYWAIIVDPVVVWGLGASAPEEAPTPKLKQAAEYFHAALRKQIQNDFELVNAPEAGALHLRVAIIDTRDSRVAIEAELLDAVSRSRLIAAVDDTGAAALDAGGDGESEEAAFDRWADVVAARLVALRNFDAAHKRIDQTTGN